MALLNPVYAFVLPFLFLVTVPLALFAGVTTTIAFSILLIRVVAVYLDVAISLVPTYLGGRKYRLRINDASRTSTAAAAAAAAAATAHIASGGVLSKSSSGSTTSPTAVPYRRHHRRRRSSEAHSVGTATSGSEGGLGLVPSIGPERDFEGVGGWRLSGDDESWTTINSRLELPDKQYHQRGHYRSPSGPPTPVEAGCLMMKGRNSSPEAKRSSPNSSRTRTPSGPRVAFGKSHVDGYFPVSKTSPKAAKKTFLQPALDL